MKTANSINIINGYVKTTDNENIAFNHYNYGNKKLLIIAHGWFMCKDSKAFMDMSESFSKFYDIITFDFRGHGKSSGKYSFGKDEIKDLSAIVEFAKNKYSEIYLIGFSLGSLISIDYCSKYSEIKKLITVSAPTDFNKIENNIFSPNAVIPTLKKFEFKRWISIRFKLPFSKKTKPINVVDKINIPIFFIAGEKDPIIKAWHNKFLYQKALYPKKELVIPKAKHAEDIYLENKEYFIKICTNWLNNGE